MYSIGNSVTTPLETWTENILVLENDFILESRIFYKRDSFNKRDSFKKISL